MSPFLRERFVTYLFSDHTLVDPGGPPPVPPGEKLLQEGAGSEECSGSACSSEGGEQDEGESEGQQDGCGSSDDDDQRLSGSQPAAGRQHVQPRVPARPPARRSSALGRAQLEGVGGSQPEGMGDSQQERGVVLVGDAGYEEECGAGDE